KPILNGSRSVSGWNNESRAIVESWIGTMDGMAAGRVSDVLHRLTSQPTTLHRWQALNQYYGLKPFSNPRKFAGALIRRLLWLPSDHAFREQDIQDSRSRRNAAKSFGIDDIREWLLITGEPGLNVVITDSGDDLLVTDTSIPIWKICTKRTRIR
nr:hypothetical protein [bacterium]